MIVTKYPKSASQQFGYALVTPSNFDSTKKYPVVILGHDSTKVGDGSSNKLSLLTEWAGYNEVKQASDVFGIVFLMIQTIHEYEYGEIQFAINTAKSLAYASSNNIHFHGTDIGGFGFLRQAGLDPTVASAFATVKIDQTKCGAIDASGDNVAAALTPTWISHAVDDTVAPYTCALNFHNDIVSNGGVSWYTQYVTGGHAITTRTFTAFGQSPNNWLPATPTGNYAATVFNAPKMSWYQWILSNKRGFTLIPPSSTYVPPSADTRVLVATVRVYSDGSVEKVTL